MFDSQCDDDLYMRHDPDIRWCVNMRRRMVVWLKKGKSCIRRTNGHISVYECTDECVFEQCQISTD